MERVLETEPAIRLRPPTVVRVEVEPMPVGRAWRFHAIAVRQRLGIYTTWRDATGQVIGYGGNVHRAFPSLAEAKFFLRQHKIAD